MYLIYWIDRDGRCDSSTFNFGFGEQSIIKVRNDKKDCQQSDKGNHFNFNRANIIKITIR